MGFRTTIFKSNLYESVTDKVVCEDDTGFSDLSPNISDVTTMNIQPQK